VRAVFFGTPQIAVPALRALARIAEIVGVVCQPDRPAGRGLSLKSPEVKVAALELGLEVTQPTRVRDGALEAWLRERRPDVALVLAYGRILPRGVLDAPARGCVNLHASLLPAYRGAAPIQWSIIRGETVTGISLMQMDEGLDSGPVYLKRSLPIGADETSGELSTRLAELAAEVTLEGLPKVVRGELQAEPQDETRVTLAPPLERAHGVIDWTQSSQSIHDLVRGLSPRPSAFTTSGGQRLRVAVTRLASPVPVLEPGLVRVERPRVLVGTGDGALELVRAQLEGKRELAALDLVNGRALADAQVLGGTS
jgi:methionyl-tRNA formyltransferase